MINQREFGRLPNGQRVDEYTLTNTRGMIAKIITYGGIISQLHVPDAHGKKADVVLGFSNLDQYLAPHPYFGCITGRVAGRLTRGKFLLDGIEYALATNDEPNHLHGGNVGLDKRLWAANAVDLDPKSPKLCLHYLSPDGEEGYPGNLAIDVYYALTDANELVIAYRAITDRATPIGLTNHAYFNLAGEGSGSVDDHILQIFADEYCPAEEKMTLRDVRETVAGKAVDFTEPRRVGDAVPGLWGRHGDNYFVRPVASGLAPVAKLTEPKSGRVLSITSTEPCLQFYSGAFLDGSLIGKSGKPYGPHAGLCLECQRYPNGVNKPELGVSVLRPGEVYQQTTVHAFSTL